MWTRRTLHECAEELSVISEDFRVAYIDKRGSYQARMRKLRDTSDRGVELLRILALSIRSEQDYKLLPDVKDIVGAIKEPVELRDVRALIRDYSPPYGDKPDFDPLNLRLALNKIAHANPAQAGYFVNETVHDLILRGASAKRGHSWIAIVSLIDLCRVICAMQDRNVSVEITDVGVNDDGLPTTVRSDGWTTCPHCDISFATYNKGSWDGQRHTSCGAYLRLGRDEQDAS